jgi:hypothetical protein
VQGVADSASTAVFMCPTCRKPHVLPGGGATGLQANFYLDPESLEDARHADDVRTSEDEPTEEDDHNLSPSVSISMDMSSDCLQAWVVDVDCS